MQRDLPTIIGVLALVLVVVVMFFANNGNKGLSLSDSNSIPTSMILGATSTPFPTQTQMVETTTPSIPLITMTPTVSATVPITTPTKTPSVAPTPIKTATPQIASCSSATPKSKILAGEFMSTHEALIPTGTATEQKTAREAKARKVLNLISTPYSDTDITKLSYWLGEDSNNEVRLYITTPTTYVASEYKYPGTLIDRGQDQDIRGTKRCQLTVTERRKITTQESTTSDDTVTRFLDFSLDADGNLELTAFRITKDAGKYSGFD